MDTQENMAVRKLLKLAVQVSPCVEEQTVAMSMSGRLAKKKKTPVNVEKGYVNCEFVLGSVPIVESLWFILKYVCTTSRPSFLKQFCYSVKTSVYGTENLSPQKSRQHVASTEYFSVDKYWFVFISKLIVSSCDCRIYKRTVVFSNIKVYEVQ